MWVCDISIQLWKGIQINLKNKHNIKILQINGETMLR
jgi:hypothetical protein